MKMKKKIFNQWKESYLKEYDSNGYTFIEEVREHFFYEKYGKNREKAENFLSGYIATEKLVNYL